MAVDQLLEVNLKLSVRGLRSKPAYNRKSFELMILAFPGALLLFLVCYLPIGNIVLAFKDFRYDMGIWGSEWIGLEHFKSLFQSMYAYRITRNTLLLNSLFIVTTIAGSLFIALMLYQVSNRTAIKFFQTSMFFPYFLSWPVVAFIVFSFLNVDLGILNRIITALGFEPVFWYNKAGYWPVILTIINFWKEVGYNVVIFYAAMLAIDNTQLEAARIDGANSWQINTKIIIPSIMSVIIMMVLIKMGRIFFADFGLFFMVTRDSGLLYETTDVLDTYVLRTVRVTGDIGLGTAVGLYQSICGLIVVLFSNHLIKKSNDGQGMI